MKNLHPHPRWVKPLSVSLLSLAIVGLSPWRLVAQASRPDSERASTATVAKARPATATQPAQGPAAKAKRSAIATTSAGKLKIAVDDIRWAGGGAMTMVESGFPADRDAGPNRQPVMPGFGARNFAGQGGFGAAPGALGGFGVMGPPGGFVGGGAPGGFARGWEVGFGGPAPGGFVAGGGAGFGGFAAGGDANGFGGGNGFAVGGPNGFAGGAGGFVPGGMNGFAGGAGDVNLIVDLHVSGPRDDRNPLSCVVVGKVLAKDDRGNAIGGPELPSNMKVELRGVDYPRGSGRAAVHLNVENKQAKSLKSLSGELLVADARVRTIVFQGKELGKAASRRLDNATIHLNEVQSTDTGVNVAVEVNIVPPRKTRSGDPLDDARKFLETHPTLQVTMEDSEGETHDGQIVGSFAGGGGGSFTSFSTGPGGVRRNTGSNASYTVSQSLQFPSLPEGVTVKKIVCTLTDIVGKPQRVPFQFHDLPLP